LAHRITRRLAEVRKRGTLPWLRPDGKAQVTVEYEGDRPVRVHTVVVSAQHEPDVTLDEVREAIVRQVIAPALNGERDDHPGREARVDGEWFEPERCVLPVNPAGRLVVGGPQGDTGLTGRKIIVDTYGGAARHGGGAFSGKDPTKVDRSGAYAARWAAK